MCVFFSDKDCKTYKRGDSNRTINFEQPKPIGSLDIGNTSTEDVTLPYSRNILRIPAMYEVKKQQNLQVLDVLRCNSANKPSFSNPTKLFTTTDHCSKKCLSDFEKMV